MESSLEKFESTVQKYVVVVLAGGVVVKLFVPGNRVSTELGIKPGAGVPALSLNLLRLFSHL